MTIFNATDVWKNTEKGSFNVPNKDIDQKSRHYNKNAASQIFLQKFLDILLWPMNYDLGVLANINFYVKGLQKILFLKFS